MTERKGAVGAIIVAAGKGDRMGLGYNKLLKDLCGKPIVEWTLREFSNSGLVDTIVLVVNPDDREQMSEICKPYINDTEIILTDGGADRQDSVYNGLKSLPDSIDIVLIHDGARPFVDRPLIERSIENTVKHGATCAGIPVKDTIKVVNIEKTVISTPDRSYLWQAQTPQAFKKSIIMEAYARAFSEGIRGTDDASLAEAAGINVTMFEGSYKNIKLTSSEDLLLAEYFISAFHKP